VCSIIVDTNYINKKRQIITIKIANTRPLKLEVETKNNKNIELL
jgi:hypothetical protein